MTQKRNQYTLDGKQIVDLPSLFRQFAAAVRADSGYFGRDLESFDDCLFGGYGLDAPCDIIWTDSEISRRALSCDLLAAWCLERLQHQDYLDEDGRRWLVETMSNATHGRRTMFDEVISTIESVPERDPDCDVRLILK